MKLRLFTVTFFAGILNTFAAVPPEYEALKTDAEKFYAEK